jgi:hypothetical protein
LMPLSVVVHIDYRKAPLVVQRFGDIKRLVDQTLDSWPLSGGHQAHSDLKRLGRAISGLKL